MCRYPLVYIMNSAANPTVSFQICIMLNKKFHYDFFLKINFTSMVSKFHLKRKGIVTSFVKIQNSHSFALMPQDTDLHWLDPWLLTVLFSLLIKIDFDSGLFWQRHSVLWNRNYFLRFRFRLLQKLRFRFRLLTSSGFGSTTLAAPYTFSCVFLGGGSGAPSILWA